MADKVRIAFRDFDGTRQQTSVDVTAASTTLQRQNIADGLQIWSIGANDGYVEEVEREAPTGLAAVSPAAQESTQLIVEMKDAVTGKVYRERLPMPDVNKADAPVSTPAWIVVGQGNQSLTIANPAHTDFATLQSAMDAGWQSPTGNAGTMVRAYIEK